MLRGEVHIVLVGLRIDAAFEIHAVQHPGAPPVPERLAGPHPAEACFESRRRGELVNQVVVGHLDVAGRHGNHAPGELGHAGGRIILGNILFAAGDDGFQIMTTALCGTRWVRGKAAGVDLMLLVGELQVHARVVLEIGLGDADADAAVGLDHHRQVGQTVGGPAGKRQVAVGILKAVVILLVEGLLVVRYIARGPGGEGGPVARKMEICLLGHHLERRGLEGGEPVGESVVISAEDHLVVLVGQTDLVETGIHLVLGVGSGVQRFADGRDDNVLVDGTPLAVEVLAVELHRNFAVLHQEFVVVAQRETQAAAVRNLRL